MLLYEYKVRDQFEKVKEYAENLRAKFDANVPSEELLKDRDNLALLCESLNELLPEEVAGRKDLERHLGWMKNNLGERKAHASRGDIEDICLRDIPKIEKCFRDWCASAVHYDKELADKVESLLIHREYDSAIRKAVLVLKSRLVTRFGLPANLDGQALVNRVFGNQGVLATSIGQDERQGMRDLLAGLYGLFRNDYMHADVKTAWHEADAVLSMINFVLKRIDGYPCKRN